MFFCKITWGYKVISFSKVNVYVEISKVIVNTFVVTNCSTGYKTGQKKASFDFHEDQELKRRWIYFVNRKDWLCIQCVRIILKIKLFIKFQLLCCGNYILYLQFIVTQNPIRHS